jgi:hypothetical protein
VDTDPGGDSNIGRESFDPFHCTDVSQSSIECFCWPDRFDKGTKNAGA